MDESALRSALASVNDCGSSLHWELRAWTFLVALGVALEIVFVVWEYVDGLHDFRRGIVHPPDRPNLLLFVLGFVGAALVAVGVSGELYAESKIATLETCIRKGNDALSLLLSREAGDAAKSAQTARAEAETVKKEARAIENRLRIASRQLAAMEHQLYVQGPRWKILENRKKEFIEVLKPLAGQKLTVVQCGSPKPAIEEYRLANDIVDFLGGPNGAGWITAGDVWTQCARALFFSNAVMIYIPDNPVLGTGQVLRAQTALIDVLNNKLGIMTEEFPPFPTRMWQTIKGGADLLAPGAPLDLVVSDPTRIVLVIGPNPMADTLPAARQ